MMVMVMVMIMMMMMMMMMANDDGDDEQICKNCQNRPLPIVIFYNWTLTFVLNVNFLNR